MPSAALRLTSRPRSTIPSSRPASQPGRCISESLPDRRHSTGSAPSNTHDPGRPHGIGGRASIMTSLLQAADWSATLGPASAQKVTQTQILDGSGGKAAATVSWLTDYFGGVVTTVPAPSSGALVTVVLGSDFTLKTFPAPGTT